MVGQPYTIKFIVDSGTINVPVEFEVSNELKMETVNNPVKISSDGTFVDIKIKNTTGKDYYTEYVFGKLEVTNSPIKLGDDMHIDVKISSLKEGIFITGYEFGKLEILNGDKWQPVEIKDWYAITGLGNIQKDNPFMFSIGINTEREKSNVYIDNLIPGHYRYSHLAEIGRDVYISDEFDIVE